MKAQNQPGFGRGGGGMSLIGGRQGGRRDTRARRSTMSRQQRGERSALAARTRVHVLRVTWRQIIQMGVGMNLRTQLREDKQSK